VHVPANLTPEYHRAEERLRQARSPEDRLAALEEMLRVIPKHKGTDHMQADLRGRIARLRKEAVKPGGRGGFSHVIPHEGAGQVALLGPPNSGKSSLVRALTHATPAVGDYPFTTREATPGMMRFEDLAFQLVDLPPLSSVHVEPWLFDLVRHADLAWIVLDGRDPLDAFDDVQRLLAPKRIELRPALSPSAVESDGSRTVRRALVVLTRADQMEEGTIALVDEMLGGRWPLVPVSVVTGSGLDTLRRQTFEAFDVIRVYTKEPGKPADRRAPFALPRGATIGDLAARIHKDLLVGLKFARVWGPSAFDGQAVQRDHVLAEGDVVELHGN
jgi:ribosome-interacting GTPase 1